MLSFRIPFRKDYRLSWINFYFKFTILFFSFFFTPNVPLDLQKCENAVSFCVITLLDKKYCLYVDSSRRFQELLFENNHSTECDKTRHVFISFRPFTALMLYWFSYWTVTYVYRNFSFLFFIYCRANLILPWYKFLVLGKILGK